MAKDIICTCGHSWNKSDSSKKDMKVCHICGKDNTMKNGGLSKYIQKIPNTFGKGVAASDASAVQQNPRKKKQIGNYKKVDSQFADAFRNILPVPDNVAQMLAKTIRGDARMSNESLDDQQKVMLWDVIQNAKKRTGKPDGGTEYQDYGGLGYGDSEQFNNWFNRGKYNVFEGAYNSLTNPGFKLGSTIGRGKYFTDPENPDKVYYTDVYDWNAHEKNFPGSNIYQKVRNTLRAGEDPNLTAEKNENYRMNFELDAKDIEKLRNKENGGWLDKYQEGGQTKDDTVGKFLRGLVTPETKRSDARAAISTAPKEQSYTSKAWDAVTHPVTAFKHLVNEGRLPNNFAAASPLGIDTALDITGLNPLGYASLFHDMSASTLNLVTGKGSLGDLITVPVTGLAMLPGAKTAANIVRRHMASNSNFYSPIFNTIEKGANKIGSKVKQVDQKLGEKIFTNKNNLPSVPDIDPSNLESLINYNLKKGLGIKKIDLPMSVTVTKNTSSGNNFNIGNILNGQRTGSVTLEQNLNPFKKQSLSRGVIDAIYPKGNAWANTPGFKKLSDFPFSNIESGNSAITYSGSDYNYNDLINSGVSGELNKAINETLKANNLGNIISGGTGHSTLGKKRWDNLVSKGHAENLGRGKYKLKENGGWLDKYEDGGEINYNDSNASAGPGFEGDGYSNVGRNYSPAWGGQFKDGGALPQYQPGGKVLADVTVKGKRQPITVTDPNDPRLKAYNDSLSLYNESKNTEAKLAKILANAYKRTGFNKSTITQALNEGKDIVLHPEKYVERGSLGYIKKYNKKGLYYGSVPGEKYLGTSQSPATIKDLIKYNKEDIKERTPYLNSLDEDINGLTNRERIESAKIASASLQKQYEIMKRTGYNPTYFIPNAERSPNLIFKKPTQPVIYEKSKPEPTSQAIIDWIEGNNSSEEFIPEVQQPTDINPIGIVEDRQTGYPHEYRKSTGELFIPFRGGQTYVDPNNPRNNPKPKMAMGGSIPGAVGFTYARTIGPPAPSNGKYAKKTKASAQNGTEMRYYQEGLDFKPKTISRNGSVIKDDMGQWAHPGEVTEIGSNQITMQGVPYPVLGISDTGDTQMMYPDEEYEYDGESVTEYPMMKQGGQLKKLDQLTNFTNYNPTKPSGWLDKYQ